MNDPGLDEPIRESSKKIENERHDEEDLERDQEQGFLRPRSQLPSMPPAALL